MIARCLPALLLLVLPLTAVAVEWEHEWQSSTPAMEATPALRADTFGHPAQWKHDAPAPLRLESNEASAAWVAINDIEAWHPADAGGTTVEFRMKVDHTAEGALYATQVICYGVNGKQRIELNFTEESVRFFDQDTVYPLNTTAFNTYRLTFSGTEALLYVNGQPEPVLRTNARGESRNLNQITFGDGSSVRIGGETEWESLRWTHQGMFPPE